MNLRQRISKKRNTKIMDVNPIKNYNLPYEFLKIQSANTGNESPILIGKKGKTFVRLDAIERVLKEQAATIKKLEGQVNTLITKGNPNAVNVLDTYDNTYKNVKNIQINYALNADKVRLPGTSNYITMDEMSVKNSKYSDTSGFTEKVKFNDGVYSMDQLMRNYTPSSLIKEGVQYSTYEEFRQYLNGKIK